MQKTMITAATVFALVMSAGASMAGPLNGHSFGRKAHDERPTVSQTLNNADHMTHTYQADRGFGQDQDSLSSSQPQQGDSIFITIRVDPEPDFPLIDDYRILLGK